MTVNQTLTAFEAEERLLRAFGYSTSIRDLGKNPRVQADKDGSCIVPNLVLHDEGRSFFFYIHVRIRDWDIPADRTDAAIMLGTLLGAYLRVAAGINATVIPEPHVAVDGELSGVFLRLDQPCSSWYDIGPTGLSNLHKALDAVRDFEELLPRILDWDRSATAKGRDVIGCRCGLAHEIRTNESWRAQIQARLKGLKLAELDSQTRVNPSWEYLRSSRFYLFESPGLAQRFSTFLCFRQGVQPNMIPNDRGYFIHEGILRTFLSKRDLRFARSVMRALSPEQARMHVCTLENVSLFFSNKYALFLDTRSGLGRYREERVRAQDSVAKLSPVLSQSAKFNWKVTDGESFEAFIFALLRAEPSVTWVKQAGSTRDRDSGKDFIAEFQLPDDGFRKADGDKSRESHRLVIVQCKLSSAPVGKSKVRDIRDTIEHHNADGFLLIVSSTITSSLVDHLLELRNRSSHYIDWWSREDIEERLVRRPDIASQYKHVVEMTMIPSN